MTEEQANKLFVEADDAMSALRYTLMEAIAQGVNMGQISATVGGATASAQWPYPYGAVKLDLKLSIEAGIPREEES